MDWQLVLVGLFVALALTYLARRAWRAWSGKGSGCGGCGSKCGSAPAGGKQTASQSLIPVEQLTLRARR